MKDTMSTVTRSIPRVVILVYFILAIQPQNKFATGQQRSACANMKECLEKLQKADHCHKKGLHFCVHANGMCYGPSQYCEKGGHGKVQQCLPDDDDQALQLCRQRLTNFTVHLPDLQCEWACEDRFNKTILQLNNRCATPQEHICPYAEGACYKPDQYCEATRVKNCLPSNENEAMQMCKKKFTDEADFPHPQCEWSCEFRFNKAFGLRLNDYGDEYKQWKTATIILLILFLLAVVLAIVLLCMLGWKRNLKRCMDLLCDDNRDNDASSVRPPTVHSKEDPSHKSGAKSDSDIVQLPVAAKHDGLPDTSNRVDISESAPVDLHAVKLKTSSGSINSTSVAQAASQSGSVGPSGSNIGPKRNPRRCQESERDNVAARDKELSERQPFLLTQNH